MPLMLIVILADPETPALATGNDISDAISAAVLVMGDDAIAELEMLAFAPAVNTPVGNVILRESVAANACEILIVIVKAPFPHTAELPMEERAPPEDAHLPLPSSHVVPASQHPGP